MWRFPMSIAEKLWSFTREYAPTLDQLHTIGVSLTEKLASYIGQELVCFHEHLVDKESLVYSVRPVSVSSGLLEV